MRLVASTGLTFDFYADDGLSNCVRCTRRTTGKLKRRDGEGKILASCKPCASVLIEIVGRRTEA